METPGATLDYGPVALQVVLQQYNDHGGDSVMELGQWIVEAFGEVDITKGFFV